MKNNVTLPLGSLSVIDKIESDYGLISGISGKVGGKSRNFVGMVKPLLCNRMDDAVSVHQILPMSSEERFGLLGINGSIAGRSLYRALQKVGREFPILPKGDELIKKAKRHKAVQMFPSKEGWIGLYPEIQHSLVDRHNLT